MSTKELADELDAADRLRARGYVWVNCKHCHGNTLISCPACQSKGGRWMPRDLAFPRPPAPEPVPQNWADALHQFGQKKGHHP